jgi:hypothetical protein
MPQLPPVPTLKTVRVTRYVTPLREGGSLPAIVEGDDDGMYVLKFRGAGQEPRALVAELVSGESHVRLDSLFRRLYSPSSTPTWPARSLTLEWLLDTMVRRPATPRGSR